MATIRIRGTWELSLMIHQFAPSIKSSFAGEARLVVHSANRAGLNGELRIGSVGISIRGRVKPGSPAVVTFSEVSREGKPIDGGLEAILYIPPWWPTIDYQYDLITGTMTLGQGSSISEMSLKERLISVTGIKPFEEEL